MAFSSDGKQLAVAGEKGVCVYPHELFEPLDDGKGKPDASLRELLRQKLSDQGKLTVVASKKEQEAQKAVILDRGDAAPTPPLSRTRSPTVRIGRSSSRHTRK